MKIGILAAPAALLALAGCDSSAVSVVCDGTAAPAVAISVVHPHTFEPLTALARGSFRVGARQDSLRHRTMPHGEVLAADGGAGSYDVEVRVPGHAVWSETGLGVRGHDCGVRTVFIVASPPPAE